MFDPRVLDAPEEFRPDRPDYHHLHFATGQHACYGRYISRIPPTVPPQTGRFRLDAVSLGV
jgi:hypothetical protein